MKLKISVCAFTDGYFDVILKDDDDNEVTLSGKHTFTPEEFELVNKLAPACVMTSYVQEEKKRV